MTTTAAQTATQSPSEMIDDLVDLIEMMTGENALIPCNVDIFRVRTDEPCERCHVVTATALVIIEPDQMATDPYRLCAGCIA